MKPDCLIVDHHENNIIRTPAGFLVPNKSIVTSDPCTLNGHSKHVQVKLSGNPVVNGFDVPCKNLNGFNGSGKSGQPMNHLNGTNFQGRNGSQPTFSDRLTNFNGNPVVLVTSTVDQNSRTSVGNFNENELLHHQLSNGIQKSSSKRNDGSTKTYVKNFDVVNSAFNEKNPGSGGLFDSSLVTQVNLSAAFHDHISYTKIGAEINKTGGILIGFNGAPSSKKHQSFQEVGFQRYDESKEQVSKMKIMILTHLDLIQHQQEMLLKKDRQLQGLKQDRESLLSRLEKMEKKMSIMSKKIVSLTEESKTSSKNGENDNFKSRLCGATKSTGSSSISSSSSSSPVFSDYFSSESASNALFIKLTNDSSFKPDDDSQSSDMMVIKSDGQLSSPVKKPTKTPVLPSKSSRKRVRPGQPKLDVSIDIKTVTKSTSTAINKKKVLSPRKKQSSTSSASSSISSQDLEKNETVEVPAVVVETLSKPDEIPFSFMVSHNSYEVVNMWDVEDFEQEERKKFISAFKLRTFSLETDETAMNKATQSSQEDVRTDYKNSESEAEMIEVPSWRVVTITGSYVMEGTENMEDEVYNKRHSKMEIDERRRKRWDIQRLREQKHNEKLKQGRYYSKAAFVSTDIKSYQPVAALDTLKNEPEPVSFFPDPMDAEVIEVCDKLPLLAFGHPIPILPSKPFSIPWNSRTKCDRKMSSQSGIAALTKSKKVTETNQGTLFTSNMDKTNVTATETTSIQIMPSSSPALKSTFNQTVPKGAKSFCSTKNRSISVN